MDDEKISGWIATVFLAFGCAMIMLIIAAVVVRWISSWSW